MGQRRGATPRGREARRDRRSPGARPGEHTVGSLRARTEQVVALRSRFTGRAAVLVLVVAALMVSYASSLRAHLEQRAHIADLERSISQSREEIGQLEREKRRWADPAYVESQARARFAFGYPGEIGYRVLDVDGDPLDQADALDDTVPVVGDGEPEWWETTLSSVAAADAPPRPDDGPADVITPPPTEKPATSDR